MHYLIDLSIGLSVSSSGAITFFCTQALGIFIEDLICSTYLSVCGTSQDQPTGSQKALGYIWVGASWLGHYQFMFIQCYIEATWASKTLLLQSVL